MGYILCLPSLLGSIATGIYVISMEDANFIAKSNRWTCIFLLRVTINKALPVTTQSFASFVYKIKHIEAESHDLINKNRSGFGAKM